MRVYRVGRFRPVWGVVSLLLVAAACTPGDAPLPDTEPTSTSVPTTTLPPLILGPGIEEGLIRLGALLPLSGLLAPLGAEVLAGHDAYWTYVNQELGGVEGFEVEVISADSQYQPDVATTEAEALADRALTISSVLGSAMTEAVLPVAAANELLVGSGAQIHAWGSEPAVLLNLAVASYLDQIRIGLAWAVDSGAVSPQAVAGFIGQEGVYGDDCAEGFRQGVADGSLTLGPEIRHGIAQTEFSAEVTAARDGGVEVLVVCTLPDGLLALVGTAELLDFHPLIIASAPSYDEGIPALLGGDAGEDAGLAQLERVFVLGAIEGPDDTAPGLRLYADNLARVDLTAPEESWYVFFGYTQAATMHAVLDEAFTARDVSRAGLRAAAGSLRPIDFGFGAGPVSFDDEGVPTAVDAVGSPRATGEHLFGLERMSDFIRLDD